jgi:predicted dithiol-disulfide oxidoreductase (DUF899 family)
MRFEPPSPNAKVRPATTIATSESPRAIVLVNACCRTLPWVLVDKEYRFETDEGAASLSDLFRGRSQLLIYHFMFGPDYTAGCPSCSAIADGFNGFQIHLANHDVMLSAISRTPLAKLQAYKKRMGWASCPQNN